MQLLVLVLNKVECLERLLKEFTQNGIKGATILDSKGMAHSLNEYSEFKFTASLRMLLDPDHAESKTIFLVTEEDRISEISHIINRVTGGLSNPDTGVMFTLPVLYTEGFTK